MVFDELLHFLFFPAYNHIPLDMKVVHILLNYLSNLTSLPQNLYQPLSLQGNFLQNNHLYRFYHQRTFHLNKDSLQSFYSQLKYLFYPNK